MKAHLLFLALFYTAAAPAYSSSPADGNWNLAGGLCDGAQSFTLPWNMPGGGAIASVTLNIAGDSSTMATTINMDIPGFGSTSCVINQDSVNLWSGNTVTVQPGKASCTTLSGNAMFCNQMCAGMSGNHRKNTYNYSVDGNLLRLTYKVTESSYCAVGRTEEMDFKRI